MDSNGGPGGHFANRKCVLPRLVLGSLAYVMPTTTAQCQAQRSRSQPLPLVAAGPWGCAESRSSGHPVVQGIWSRGRAGKGAELPKGLPFGPSKWKVEGHHAPKHQGLRRLLGRGRRCLHLSPLPCW